MDFKLAIVVALVLSSCLILLGGRRGVRRGFLVWIATLAIGYRTVPFMPGLNLHPSALLLVALFLWLLLTASSKVRTIWWTPMWLLMLIPFFGWGWVAGQRAGFQADLMFSELQSFILFIPLFAVVATVLDDRREWAAVIITFFATATFVATLGVLEYYFPGIRSIFPQFVSNAAPLIAGDGFARAAFSFWGHPAASFICALAIPFAHPLLQRKGTQAGRICIGIGLALLLVAVYISGYRVLWLSILLQGAMWLSFQRKHALALIIVVVAIGGYTALPEATKLRAESFVIAMEGAPTDSSSEKHLSRVSDAVDAIIENPFGFGWTGSGWVHSDFIQIAANLGVIPGVIFAGAFVWTGLGLFKMAKRRVPQRSLNVALLLSFLTTGGIMSSQVIYVLPQLACPVWLIWALAGIAVRQQQSMRKEVHNHVPNNFGLTPHFQLRDYYSQDARIR